MSTDTTMTDNTVVVWLVVMAVLAGLAIGYIVATIHNIRAGFTHISLKESYPCCDHCSGGCEGNHTVPCNEASFRKWGAPCQTYKDGGAF